jgi:hypothetical protein
MKSSALHLAFFPIVGASVHIVQKFLFEMKVDSISFHKPIFFTWLGSVGMFLPIFTLRVSSDFLFKLIHQKDHIFLLKVSTIFNLIAGFLSNYSSLYLNYSISLMLRTATFLLMPYFLFVVSK